MFTHLRDVRGLIHGCPVGAKTCSELDILRLRFLCGEGWNLRHAQFMSLLSRIGSYDIRNMLRARSGGAGSRQATCLRWRPETRTECRSPRWWSKSRSAHTRYSPAAATET